MFTTVSAYQIKSFKLCSIYKNEQLKVVVLHGQIFKGRFPTPVNICLYETSKSKKQKD